MEAWLSRTQPVKGKAKEMAAYPDSNHSHWRGDVWLHFAFVASWFNIVCAAVDIFDTISESYETQEL